VVRSRVKYVVIAAGISSILYLIFGGSVSNIPASEAEQLLSETADPTGLPMLIPALIVFFVAVSGRHFLAAITAGIVASIIIGPITGVFPLERVFHLTGEGSVAGTAVSGAMSLLPTAILTLLLVTIIGIIEAGGFLEIYLSWLKRVIAKTIRSTELAIIGLISLMNICVSVNTVAMITAGPLANSLRKLHNIHPHRSANLIDTISCSFPYVLPYSATIVAAAAIQREISQRYAFVEILDWTQEASYFFYGIVLFPLMIIAAITGFGRKTG